MALDDLTQMLFDEECGNLEKALSESENDRIDRADHENSVRTLVLLSPQLESDDLERSREILKRVV